MRNLVLIDGDILVYRTGFAGQQTLWSARPHACKDWLVQDAPNRTTLLRELEALGVPEEDCELRSETQLDSIGNVFHSLDLQIQHILDKARASSYRLYLTGEGNFREQIAKVLPYKGNRVAEKPIRYPQIRERLFRRWGAEEVHGAEADDALAIGLTENPEAVCCSIDKDLRQVPGMHLNWVKDDSPFEVLPRPAAEFLFAQSLSGDSTDNIPGLPGVGLKTAYKHLYNSPRSTWEELASSANAQYCGTYGEIDGLSLFTENFNLVYLCRTREELEHAKQAASKGNPGLSPWSVAAARIPLPPV